MGDGDRSPPPPPHHPPPPAHHHQSKIPDPKHTPPQHYGDEDREDDHNHKQKHNQEDGDDHYQRHAIAKGVATFLFLLGLIALIVYLIYRPEHPQFSVSAASINSLSATAPPLLSASLQFTILLRNPNHRLTVQYDRLSAYVTYHDQAITPITPLPPLHQRTRSLVSATPVLGGGANAVPVSAEVLNGLAADQSFGVVGLRMIVVGRMRWKAGAIKSSWKLMTARCDLMVGYRGGSPGHRGGARILGEGG